MGVILVSRGYGGRMLPR